MNKSESKNENSVHTIINDEDEEQPLNDFQTAPLSQLRRDINSEEFEDRKSLKKMISRFEIWDEEAKRKLEENFFANFTFEVKTILEKGKIDFKNIAIINGMFARLLQEVNTESECKGLYDRLKEKNAKIEQQTFNWKVDNRALPYLKQIFNIADVCFDQDHFTYINHQNLQQFLPPILFINFMQVPYHSYDEGDQMFFEITEFQSIVISGFKKLYIQFALSDLPRIYPGEVNLVDPFMRQMYREKNLEFFKTSCGLPQNFSLMDFITNMMEKVVFSGLPRWEQKVGKPFLVPFLDLIAESFDHGLITNEECDLLLSQLYMTSELLSLLEQQIKRRYTTYDPCVEKYYHEFIACRISISKILIHIICVYCDFDFLDSVQQLNSSARKTAMMRYSVQHKKTSYSNISLIVLKYLAPKIEIASVKNFSSILDHNLSLIFNFIGDYQNDFFTQSLSLVRPEYQNYYTSKSLTGDNRDIAHEIVSKMDHLAASIRASTVASSISFQTQFSEITALIIKALKDYEYNFDLKLELNKHNIPAMLIQLIDIFDRIGCESESIINNGVICLGMILRKNYPGQSVLFTGSTFSNYKSIFLRHYLVTMNMLQVVFNYDYTLFNLTNRVFITKIEIYKQLVKNFRDLFRNNQRSSEFIDILGSLYFFNFFYDNILETCLKKTKNKKRYDVVIATEIVRIIDDFVFPAFYKADFLRDYTSVDFKNESKITDFHNFETVRLYFKSKPLNVSLYELYYSFLKLFNKSTFFVYSGEVYEVIRKETVHDKFVDLPKGFPGEITVRIEMLKMFDRFQVFYSNHLINKREEYNKNTAVIIGQKFIPENTVEIGDKIINEFKWFNEYLSNSSNITNETAKDISRYLLKGLLAMSYKYLKGIIGFVTIMETPERIKQLKERCDKICSEISTNADKFYRIIDNLTNKSTDFLSLYKDSMVDSDGKASSDNPLSAFSGLFSNAKSKLMKGTSLEIDETNFESDVAEERINPDLKHIRGRILKTIDILDRIYKLMPEAQYVINRYSRKSELDMSSDNMAKIVGQFNTYSTKFSSQMSSLTSSKKQDWTMIAQIKVAYRSTKEYYYHNRSENIFVQYLTVDVNCNKYNRAIAEFFIDQMAYMETSVQVNEYERSFFINNIYTQYITTMNNLLSWTNRIRVELHNILYASKCRAQDKPIDLPDLQPEDVEYYKSINPSSIECFFKTIWGTYMTLMLLIFFKTFIDSDWEEYSIKFYLVSSFMQNLCENNYVKFKQLLNTENYGMIDMLRGQKKMGDKSVFFENYIILEVASMNSNFWLNDDRKIVPSDRPELFPIISQLMDNVTEMVNGPCKMNQLKIYCFRVDMWTGIVNRIIDDLDSKFYEVKLSCLCYFSALLEGLDDTIVQFMGSNLEVHKLFNMIILLTKKLYIKRRLANKQVNVTLQSKKVRPIQSLVSMSKLTAGLNALAKNAQHMMEEINRPEQLVEMYNKYEEFSEHIIMNIVITAYVLIKNMATKIKFYEIFLKDKDRIAKNYSLEVGSKEEAVVFEFINRIMVDIQIVYKSNDVTSLQRFYFKLPPRCFFLSNEMKNRFMELTTFESTTAKRHFLYNNIDALSIEMEENQKNFARFSGFSHLMTNDAYKTYQIFLTLISFALNVLMLVYLENNDGKGLKSSSETGEIAMTTLGYLSAIFSFICALLWLMSKYKIECKMQLANMQALSADPLTHKEIFQTVMGKSLIFHRRFGTFFLQCIFSLLGLYVNYVFFTINVLILANIFKPIKYIMRSIINHYDKLLVTLILTILVIFSYSFIILDQYLGSIKEDEFGESVCDNFVACFINSVNLGLRLDGGIGDALATMVNTNEKGPFWGRFFFDITFFIIVRLILLNVIAGIIIDTFSDMRDEMTRRNNDLRNICYICGIDRWKLEQKGIDFDEHTENDHNKWKYLFFIIKLSLSGKQTFTGIEYSVWEQYENYDTSWMPNEMYLKKGENYALLSQQSKPSTPA